MFCYGIPLGFDVSKLGLNQVGMWGPWENRPEVTNCLMSSRVCFHSRRWCGGRKRGLLNWAWRNHNIRAQKGGRGDFKHWESCQHFKSWTFSVQDPACPTAAIWSTRACMLPMFYCHRLEQKHFQSHGYKLWFFLPSHLYFSLQDCGTWWAMIHSGNKFLFLIFLCPFPLHLSPPSRLLIKLIGFLPSAWLTKPWS